ncbi:hypothetical protein KKB40_05695, partial [Patescibacteria group bacterium]|nr:hypothetical protein [Patescibacteria group bacterium]
MKSTKLRALTVILFILGVFVWGLLSARKKPSEDTTKRQPIPTLRLSKFIDGKLPISLSFKEEDFNFPSEMPLLTVSPKFISEEEARQIAENLGLPEEPKIVDDTREGTKYIWTNQDSFLFITPSTASIKYGLSLPEPPNVANKQLNQDSLINIATKFLSDNQIVPQEEIKFTSIIYYKGNSQSGGFQKTTKENANMYQLNFTYKISDLEILNLEPSKPLVFIQILPDGSIYNLEVIRMKTVTNTENKYLIKNYEDLQNSLSEAVLISLLNDYVNLSDLSINSIKSINIDKIQLTYLLDSPLSNTLQPVFL